MRSIPDESVGRINLPLIIPDDTHPTAPSAYENMTGSNITPPDILCHSDAPFIFLPHDEEQPQSTFSDNESTMGESVGDKRTFDTIDHPHALDTIFHGHLGLLVQHKIARGQLGLFRIPEGPANASMPPTSGRLSAGVARRNRLFALDDNRTGGPQGDDLVARDALEPTVETQGPPSIELDGGVREADHELLGTLEGWAETDLASLKPLDIHRDNPSPKVKTCTTIH